MEKNSISKIEYERLIKAFKNAGATDILLEINDKWIRKTADLYADLESLKTFKNLVWKGKDTSSAKETAASKMKIKYMAQYNSAMLKLNKILISTFKTTDDEDDELEEFDD